MNAKFSLTKPDDLEATLTVTLKCREWRAMRAQLKDAHPAWLLSKAITDVLLQSERVFYANEQKLDELKAAQE